MEVAELVRNNSFNLSNRKVSFDFIRSRETVSRYFHIVLNTIIILGSHYVLQQETIMEGFDDEKIGLV